MLFSIYEIDGKIKLDNFKSNLSIYYYTFFYYTFYVWLYDSSFWNKLPVWFNSSYYL